MAFKLQKRGELNIRPDQGSRMKKQLLSLLSLFFIFFVGEIFSENPTAAPAMAQADNLGRVSCFSCVQYLEHVD